MFPFVPFGIVLGCVNPRALPQSVSLDSTLEGVPHEAVKPGIREEGEETDVLNGNVITVTATTQGEAT